MSELRLLPTPQRLFCTCRWIVADAGAVRKQIHTGLTDAARRDLATAGLPTNWLDLRPEGYLLTISEADGAPVVTIVAADVRGQAYAERTLAQLIDSTGEGIRLPLVQIADWPVFALRGVVEGFYGRPWSHDERLGMIDFCGQSKLNVLFYAPKDDPFHREDWRTPYPTDRLTELVALIDRCQAADVDFIFSVSPGSSICFSSDEDFTALCAKLDAVFAHGVRHFALLLDDIDARLAHAADRERYADAAEAQADLTNRLLARYRTMDPRCRITLCPTEYSENEPSPYRAGLARYLDPAVAVIWTGVGIIAPTISGDDADRIAGYFGHDLLLWDNYPVNDYATDSLFLGPVRNRDPRLAEHHHVGVVANPMNQAEASKIALWTLADYLWNPAAYRPEDSWRHACHALAGDTAFAPLWHFCQYSESTRLWRHESPFAVLCRRYWASQADPIALAAADLAMVAEIEALLALPDRLRQKLANRALLADIEPWFAKLVHQAEAALMALSLLREVRAATPADLALGAARRDQLWERRIDIERARLDLETDEHAIGGGAFADFSERVLAALPPELQFGPLLGVSASTDFPAIPVPAMAGITNLTAEPDHPLAAMLDDEPTTFFRGAQTDGKATRAGDYVGIDLGREYAVSGIHVSLTEHTPARGTHFWRQIACEGSRDGRTWEMLIGRPGRPESRVSWEPRPMRYVRIVSTLDQDDPIAVRAFRVAADSPEVPPQRGAFSPTRVVDGRRDTGFLTRGPVTVGQGLTLDFGAAKVIRGVTVLQDGVRRLGKAVVEASGDGREWKEIGEVSATAVTFVWRGEARYLRLRALTGSDGPVRLVLFQPEMT